MPVNGSNAIDQLTTLGVPQAEKVVTTNKDNEISTGLTVNKSSANTGSSTEVANTFTVTMTGAGGLGRAILAKLVTNVALGSYSNAFKALVQAQTSGKATGLLSVINAEMELPGSNVGAGTFAIYEAEIIQPASSVVQELDILFVASTGAGKADVDDKAYLIRMDGFTSGAAHVWFDQTEGAASAANEWIRIKTPNGAKYLAVYDAVGSP